MIIYPAKQLGVLTSRQTAKLLLGQELGYKLNTGLPWATNDTRAPLGPVPGPRFNHKELLLGKVPQKAVAWMHGHHPETAVSLADQSYSPGKCEKKGASK